MSQNRGQSLKKKVKRERVSQLWEGGMGEGISTYKEEREEICIGKIGVGNLHIHFNCVSKVKELAYILLIKSH